MKWNYLTDTESKMKPDLVDLQIVLGLQTCKTKEDVLKLLKDVRQHERLQKEIEKKENQVIVSPHIRRLGKNNYTRVKGHFREKPREKEKC